MKQLKEAGEGPGPSEGESIEEDGKDDKGESGGTTSTACKSFKEDPFTRAKVLEDSDKSLPMADYNCHFHEVSVMYHRPTRF